MKFFKSIAAASVIRILIVDANPGNTETKSVTEQDYAECKARSRSISELTEEEKKLAWEKALKWKQGNPTYKPCSLPGVKVSARTGDGSQPDEPWSSQSTCPPGTKRYRTSGIFGLGARDIGCMTAYEAESLRRQQRNNIQRNIQNNRPRTCFGSANTIGRTTYGTATCY